MKALNMPRNPRPAPYNGQLSQPSRRALLALSPEMLRAELLNICRTNESAHKVLQKRLETTGSQVVRYHKDTDSEQDENSEEEDEDEGDDDDDEVVEVAVADNALVARYQKCENCKQAFDVTTNERGDCVWHPGKFYPQRSSNSGLSNSLTDQMIRAIDAEIWGKLEDDDDPCPLEDYQNIPLYKEEGFYFPCCDENGIDEGCRRTKHKAAVNAHPQSLKRKAEDALPRPLWRSCRQCRKKYDALHPMGCRHHPGAFVFLEEG